ncbi:MAG TPA: alanine--tRNA ligase, partial [Candidatus Faecousia gallistercoris]|nr:alanine--tRNA ligase [Candidatus Faecousia gallistercoris]
GSGPCGPCSEIYYDRGEKFGCGKPDCTVGCDCDRYMEVWNNVFSQFDHDGHGHYSDLAQKNIDTGMGLERLAVVCQDVDSLFDVDTVMNITNRVTALTGAAYGQSHRTDVSLRVITDHIRAATFMIADGVLPSNEGRGYVLRRLLRRAARHGRLLGVQTPFLFQVVETVVHENEGHYSDLRERADYIIRVVRTEEENFARTIDGGMKIFADLMASHKAKGETVFSGADAFKLYDTYGFPIDLTAEMVEDEGMTVDQESFAKLMQEQKLRAREARKALGDLAWAGIDLGLDSTPTEFTGYEKDTDTARVLAVCVGDEVTGVIAGGETGIVVLDRTPFYAEMGGQTADHGTITVGQSVFQVTNVQKDKAGKYLHYGKLQAGEIKVDDSAVAAIDVARRTAVRRAHSATHLLQSALVRVLGDHCHQAGSLVEPDRLRFDFTHYEAISKEDLKRIEAETVGEILSGAEVETLVLPLEEAKQLGATALFGEKYGDTVRVVKMGDFSLEFCGGTHLDNTAKAGLFHIVSESSIASGVRRIEAVTGPAVLEQLAKADETIAKAAEAVKANPAELVRKAEQTAAELKEARRIIEQYQAKESAGGADEILRSAGNINGLHVAVRKLSQGDANSLRQLGDALRDKDPAVVAVLALVGEKVTFQAVCGKDAVARGIRAGDVIKAIAPICGGRGGGKPDSAMGGGSDLSKVDAALAAAEDFVAAKLA